eukprot:3067296-Rhodomonas_salina.1
MDVRTRFCVAQYAVSVPSIAYQATRRQYRASRRQIAELTPVGYPVQDRLGGVRSMQTPGLVAA